MDGVWANNPQPSAIRLDFTTEEAHRHAIGGLGTSREQIAEGIANFLSGQSGVVVEQNEAAGLIQFLNGGTPVYQRPPA